MLNFARTDHAQIPEQTAEDTITLLRHSRSFLRLRADLEEAMRTETLSLYFVKRLPFAPAMLERAPLRSAREGYLMQGVIEPALSEISRRAEERGEHGVTLVSGLVDLLRISTQGFLLMRDGYTPMMVAYSMQQRFMLRAYRFAGQPPPFMFASHIHLPPLPAPVGTAVSMVCIIDNDLDPDEMQSDEAGSKGSPIREFIGYTACAEHFGTVCWHCGLALLSKDDKATTTMHTKKKNKCGRCKGAIFCNRECFVAAWPAHKRECRLIARAYTELGFA